MSISVSNVLWALLFGSLAGMGLWSLVAALPMWQRPTLMDRVAPYVREVSDPQGSTPALRRSADPATALIGVGTAMRRCLVTLLAKTGASQQALERRLRSAGLSIPVDRYRSYQLLALACGAAAGFAVGSALTATGKPALFSILLPVLGGAAGLVLLDQWLSRRAKLRTARMQDELPTVLEFLSLCLSAGEGLTSSIRRVSEVGTGALCQEFQRVVLDVETGSPLATALSDLSARADLPALSRALDHLIAAIERGAPLAEVLGAQALDAQDEHKRVLLELAGRKEVTMLVPLVFLILPLSILIAVFPGLQLIRLGAP